MRYFLKMAQSDLFDEVDKYTFDNHKYALADDGESPRYLPNSWMIAHDDGTVSVSLVESPSRDLPILGRSVSATMPDKAGLGNPFVNEPAVVKFKRGKLIIMRELKTGEEWKKKIA